MNASNTSTAQDIGVARDEKEESRLLKFIDELYQQKEQAVQDAKLLAKALESIQRNQNEYYTANCGTSLRHSSCQLSPEVLSILDQSDVTILELEHACQPQVGKTLIPKVVFDSNYLWDDMKWKWFVGDEFNYKLVSTECFYTPNPDDVNQNLQVEWTRKLNGDCVMQNYHLGKIRLSCCVENLLMSFEMMGKAIFTRIRNYRGEVCTMFLEREYISINRELETHSKCIFHFDMKDIRIDCLAGNRSSFGFCINLKYEFFVETRLELILIYCTIRLFALSAEDCRKNSLSSEDSVGKEKTTEDEIQKRIRRSTNNYFLKRFPLSQRLVEEKCHSSNSTSKPLQISRPIPESVWHAKEDMPRQTL